MCKVREKNSTCENGRVDEFCNNSSVVDNENNRHKTKAKFFWHQTFVK